MELTELVFKVRTQELVDAKSAILELGTAISKLDKITADEAKSAIAAEKVKQQQAKTAKEIANAKSAEAKSQEVLAPKVQNTTTALERQQKILEYMTQGFSRGQSSILATASAANTATEDLKKLGDVLQTQRRLIGGDTFDKSMSGLVALTNQYGEIREAIRQYNSDTELTRNQTRELARDKERIIEKMKLEGASFSQIKSAIREYNATYVETASKVNALTKAEKERERNARDTANAVRNVQSAEERLFATVTHLNEGISQNSSLNERAALALGSYERNLRLAGITGEQAAKKLQAFKAAQEQVSAAEAKTRASYVSRGIGVQAGDVLVSLASGMNPLTVAIQQGDQIRGLLQQSGLEAKAMGGIMQQAFAGIITSFKDVGVAMGSFVVGGIKTMGAGFLDLVGKTTGLSVATKMYKEEVLSAGPPTEAMLSRFKLLDKVTGLVGLGITSVVVAIGALTIATIAGIKEQYKLNQLLNLQGASLGMNTDAAYTYANSLKEVGIRQTDTIAIISEMAKVGKLSSDNIELITKSAVKLRDVGGVAIEETVKAFSDLAKDPVKAVESLNEKYSFLTSTVYLQIKALQEEGKTVEAAKVAQQAYADMIEKRTQNITDNLGFLETAWKTVSKAASDAWDSMLNAGRANPEEDLNKALATMQGKSFIQGGLFSGDKSEALAIIKMYEAKVEAQKKDSETQIKNNKATEGTIELSKIALEFADKKTKKQLELNNATEAYSKALAGAAGDTALQVKLAKQYENAVAGINDKYKEKEKKDKVRNGKLTSDDNALATLQAKLLASEQEYAIISLTTNAQYKLTEADKERMKIQEQINTLKEKGTKGLNSKEVEAQKNQLDSLKEQLVVVEQLAESQKKVNLLRLEIQMDEDLRVLQMFPEEREKEIKLLQIRNQLGESWNRLTDPELEKLKQRTAEEIERNKVIQYRDQLIQNSYANKQKEFGRQVQGVNEASAGGGISTGDKNTFTAQTLSNMGVENTKAQTDAQLEIYRAYYEQLDVLLANNLISEEDYSNSKIQLAVKENSVKYKAFDSFLTGMTSLQSSNIKELAALGKAAAVVQATINTYEGATKAMAQGGIFGPILAAAVIAQGMAQVAAIKSQGFSEGGYTGPGGKYEPAGIVHKGEVVWSQKDVRNAGGISAVESMRKGIGGYSDGGIVSSPMSTTSVATAQSSGVNVVIENYGTSKDFEVQQISENEVRIIARDEARAVMQKETPKLVATQVRNPNSDISKSLSQNTQTQRRR